MDKKRKILILGSTGSIGTQTLDIISHYKDRFQVVGISGHKNYALLNEQIEKFQPAYCAIGDESLAKHINSSNTKILSGHDGIIEMCNICGADIAVCAIVGIAGLESTIACIKQGMTIALANKETLVAGGSMVTNLAKLHNTPIYPVDSEHSAIFQCLQSDANIKGIKNIYLTASGGPFVDTPMDAMKNITVEQALKHPNWSMGAKITIDSATMMNKGLEVIEAKYLFDLNPSQIKVCVHRKSIVHSMVEFMDNSILAQLGNPDMRIPIQYAIMYPERVECPSEPLDIFSAGALEFEKPDFEKFPCLAIAFKSLEEGGGRSLVINSANEEAVAEFLAGNIKYTQIYDIIESAYINVESLEDDSLESILETDRKTRAYCRDLMHKRRT
ncbi:MAG: 1-deoxy-D-xylulose-5-phosphate reductoisomerase [Eubacteriales bacterium]